MKVFKDREIVLKNTLQIAFLTLRFASCSNLLWTCHVHCLLTLLRLGRGSSLQQSIVCDGLLGQRQFPITESLHTELITLRACVFLQNSPRLGFSFWSSTLPDMLRQEKFDSIHFKQISDQLHERSYCIIKEIND